MKTADYIIIIINNVIYIIVINDALDQAHDDISNCSLSTVIETVSVKWILI